ncbi:hypothetical protein DRF65_18505 [Chryseobacterium pennae]|uniref:TonB C-terminal domain-containing protein n=1 Tax=Chryseobacterium pennae TaxID=2258962 RepID=A0A3D9C4X5_9FLAO|nr:MULTISPECIES: energy transducer TonB [Chryseobacterium]REC60799.1 hypothetical protein DRF65_18505 [Chryseobacterium pennae]
MKQIITILFLTFSVTLFSQDLKTFEGNYKEGTAKYNFYKGKENNIILEGKFEYFKAKNQSEIGQHTQNLKVGTWKYHFENDGYKIEFYGNYTNDLKNGIWIFKFLENGISESYSLEFQDDILVGEVNWSGLKGEFDTKGRFIGIWEVKNDNDKYDATFNDNILIMLEKRTLNNILLSVYRPDTYSTDFTKLSFGDNPIIRKEYNLDWNFRLMSGEFNLDKIYDINRVTLDGISETYLEREIFFNAFFESITDKLNDKIFDYTNWTYFKLIELKNNPDFLYLNTQTIKPKKEAIHNNFNLDNLLVDEKPVFKDGNSNFIPFIKDNYFNFDEVSGNAVIEFLIDTQGNINILNVKTTGNFSEKEIRRVLNLSPKWTPAKKEGKPIDVKIVLPINVNRN